MYVAMCTEVEVKTTDDAYKVFLTGNNSIKRKRFCADDVYYLPNFYPIFKQCFEEIEKQFLDDYIFDSNESILCFVPEGH